MHDFSTLLLPPHCHPEWKSLDPPLRLNAAPWSWECHWLLQINRAAGDDGAAHLIAALWRPQMLYNLPEIGDFVFRASERPRDVLWSFLGETGAFRAWSREPPLWNESLQVGMSVLDGYPSCPLWQCVWASNQSWALVRSTLAGATVTLFAFKVPFIFQCG